MSRYQRTPAQAKPETDRDYSADKEAIIDDWGRRILTDQIAYCSVPFAAVRPAVVLGCSRVIDAKSNG